jgi:hypothetical protein
MLRPKWVRPGRCLLHGASGRTHLRYGSFFSWYLSWSES